MRKVYLTATVELTVIANDEVNVDDVVQAWADQATCSDLTDEAGNNGADVIHVVLKDAQVIDSK